MKKFLFFLIILLIAAWFIAVNALTTTDIVLFIPIDAMKIKDLPLSYCLLASFLLGVVVTLAFSLIHGKKKPQLPPDPDFKTKLQEAAVPKSEDAV